LGESKQKGLHIITVGNVYDISLRNSCTKQSSQVFGAYAFRIDWEKVITKNKFLYCKMSNLDFDIRLMVNIFSSYALGIYN
jgi:hypothetical protein